jgi:alkylation response protein AidB-like acyl-CoA dehydrogenase
MDDLSARGTAAGRAAALFDLISGEAEAADRLGRLTDPVIQGLHGARLFEIMIPERYGGWGAAAVALFEATEEVARADGSAAWCLSMCNMMNRTAFLGLPPEGRDEMFGHGPTACWAALRPGAACTPDGDGFRVSYAGAYGTGSAVSDWVQVVSYVGEVGAGQYRGFVIPKAEVEIKAGSWDVMGLRATASIDYSINDVFVPARRSWTYGWTARGWSGPLAPLQQLQLNAIGLAGFASGVARRAQDELIALALKTKRGAGEGLQAEDHMVQFGIGELDGRLRAARTHILALVARFDERAASGDPTTPDDDLEISQATHTLARAAREMVIFAFDHASTSVVYARAPLQRCLRDIFTGLKHYAFTPSLLGRIGKARLGLPSGMGPV